MSLKVIQKSLPYPKNTNGFKICIHDTTALFEECQNDSLCIYFPMEKQQYQSFNEWTFVLLKSIDDILFQLQKHPNACIRPLSLDATSYLILYAYYLNLTKSCSKAKEHLMLNLKMPLHIWSRNIFIYLIPQLEEKFASDHDSLLDLFDFDSYKFNEYNMF